MTVYHSLGLFSRRQNDMFPFFGKIGFDFSKIWFYFSCKRFEWKVTFYFSGKKKEKNISECRLLEFLSSMLSVKVIEMGKIQVILGYSELRPFALQPITNYSLEFVYYENIPIQIYRKFHLQKMKIFRKNSDIFHISAQNIDCGYSLEPPRRGGSNEYPQSMFLSRNKNMNVNPSFTTWKWGSQESKLYRRVFVVLK